VARFGPPAREARALLELLAVAGLAVALPMFDLLGRNAALFVAWRATPAKLVVLTALLALAPAVTAWGVEVVVGLAAPRARWWCHVGLLGGFSALVALQVAKQQTDLGPPGVVTVAVGGGIVAGALFARFSTLRLWLRFLAVAPVLLAVVFVVASPVTSVVFDADPPVAEVRAEHPSRVVMVVFDELPLESLLDGNGAIDAQLFPSFAALAGTSTWYRNETTVAANTDVAVPAILSGGLPTVADPIAIAPHYPRNLFTMLGGQYAMNVHESVTRLCPTSLCVPRRRSVDVRAGFTGMVRDVADIWGSVAAPTRAAEIDDHVLGGVDGQAYLTGERFVQTLRPSARPRLDFLHVLLPHFPWHYLPTGQDHSAFPAHATGLSGPAWANQQVAEVARVRHLLQAQATDTLLGQIVARLRAIDAFDDTLLVVTADHGVAFRAGLPFRGVAESTYPSIMWTPLFVKAPGQARGAVDDRPAESIDVLPTIADHLGVDVPWRLAGRSLLGEPRRDGDRPLAAWSSNVAQPAPGRDRLAFDGPAGFATVLGRGAAAPEPTADWRVYRVGPFGHLLGQRAAPWIAAGAPIPGTLDDPARYSRVVPESPRTPWVRFHGTLRAGRSGTPIAFVVNGVVAATTWTYRVPGGGLEFWGTVPPAAFRPGANEVTAHVIEGPGSAPRLRPVTR
jgi:hypothetical protein